jgi:hypothetical protein
LRWRWALGLEVPSQNFWKARRLQLGGCLVGPGFGFLSCNKHRMHKASRPSPHPRKHTLALEVWEVVVGGSGGRWRWEVVVGGGGGGCRRCGRRGMGLLQGSLHDSSHHRMTHYMAHRMAHFMAHRMAHRMAHFMAHFMAHCMTHFMAHYMMAHCMAHCMDLRIID